MIRQNNFDFLRLTLALAVFLLHTAILTGLDAFRFIKNFLNVETPVHAFFVISGFLIVMSYNKDSSLSSYFSKRIRRIYPGYLAVILCSIAIGAVISEHNISDYFSKDLASYFFSNITFANFIQPCLPGLFTDNRICAINGSLWTIKIEVMFYLFVPVLVYLIRKHNTALVLLLLFITSTIWKFTFLYLAEAHSNELYTKLAIQLPGQLPFFIAGAYLYYYKPEKKIFHLFFATSIIFFLIRHYTTHNMFLEILYPVFLAIIVIYVANSFIYLGNFAKFGDHSYGVYIWHFPVIQTFIYFDLYQSPTTGFILSTIALLFLSTISWHLIEKKFLLKSSHYIVSKDTA